jgi:glycerate kinase
MKVIVAPDKFKGSLTAPEAARAIARGVLKAEPSAEIDLVPMADGGEGTVEALVEATGGIYAETIVTGPLGHPVEARFGILGDQRTAVIEMAAASGLVLVRQADRDPLRASTFGTGELILAAIRAGADRLIVGIGGSATNDGGAGMAQALGYRMVDADGEELLPGGGPLFALDRIIRPEISRISGVEIAVACDVANPLCGPTGASAVYGPQKGASPEVVAHLDSNLARLARVIERDLGFDVADRPGSGAAGGLGAGMIAFAEGNLEPGASLVIQAVGLLDRLQKAELCITAEGSVDASSAFGKTAVGVARLAHSLGCPTLVLAGSIGPGAEDVLAEGVDAYFSLCPGPSTLGEAMSHAPEWLERVAEQATRAFLAGRRGNSRQKEAGR